MAIQINNAAYAVPSTNTMSQTALPMLIPSSGSIGNNGALSGITAIPLSGGYTWGCYMYFPAGAVFSGSTAGMYYVVMSANNAGTIYNNMYISGTPSIPSSPTPIVATGPGAYTQTTGSEITLMTITMPPNIMGKMGVLTITPAYVYPNNANSKTLAVYFSSSVLYAKTRTTSTQETPLIDVRNRGVTNRQFSAWATSAGPATSSTSGVVNMAIDTTLAVDITFRVIINVATDYAILESAGISVSPFG